jgi:hypothetical protein
MSTPISVPLDDNLRRTQEEAHRVRRERIRQQSRAVGAHVAASPEAREFYDDWSSSRPDGV